MKEINSSVSSGPKDIARESNSSGSKNSSAPAGIFSQRRARYFGEESIDHADRIVRHSFISEGALSEETDILRQDIVLHDPS